LRRETVGSLSGYFAIVGLLSGLIYIPFLVNSHGNILLIVLGSIGVGISSAFLCFSFSLRRLLIKHFQILRAVIIFRVILGITISLLPALSGSLPPANILRIVITLWVGMFIMKRVQTLSAKLRSQQ